ncbi:MAG: DUF5666 domain-containing protein [Aggregatilineales bacterium]
MFVRWKGMWVILILLVGVLGVGVASLSAASSADRQANEVKIEGILTSYTGSVMVVSGQPIDVSRAVIRSGVAVGQRVEIYALPLPGGVWLAREVELDDDRSRNRSEITGVIEAINGTQVTIGGRAFDIGSAAVEGTPVVGSVVELKLVRTFAMTGTDLWVVDRAEIYNYIYNYDDRGRGGDHRGRGGDRSHDWNDDYDDDDWDDDDDD